MCIHAKNVGIARHALQHWCNGSIPHLVHFKRLWEHSKNTACTKRSTHDQGPHPWSHAGNGHCGSSSCCSYQWLPWVNVPKSSTWRISRSHSAPRSEQLGGLPVPRPLLALPWAPVLGPRQSRPVGRPAAVRHMAKPCLKGTGQALLCG